MNSKKSDPQQRSLRIVLNGKSAALPEVREAVAACRKAGHDVEVRVTWEGGQAAEFAEEAARQGRDIVIAAGGDGTVSDVATGVLAAGAGVQTAIGIMPLGTANDFATACGIPRNMTAALTFAVTAAPRLIDVGTVNDRPFINVASAGIGAQITAETPAGVKRVLGGAAYSLVGIFKAFTMTPHEGRLITPEGTYSGKMMLMAIGNSRLAGGGFRVAPRALLDDGLLDLVIVPDVTIPETGSIVSEMIRLETEEPQQVVYRQLPSFTIESNHEIPMNLDGEPIHANRFEVSVLPRRLNFLLPPEAPLSESDPHASH
jgi:lipid kinase YegS